MDKNRPSNNEYPNVPDAMDAFLKNAEALGAAALWKGQVVSSNKQFDHLFGLSSCIGQTWDSLLGVTPPRNQNPGSGVSTVAFTRPDGSKLCGEAVIIEWESDKQFSLVIIHSILNSETHLRDDEHYRALVDQTADGIFICDETGHYIDINTQGCMMLGYTRDELHTMRLKDIVTPKDHPKLRNALSNVRKGRTLLTEWTIIRRDGSTFPCEVTARMLSSGCMLGVLKDISERKHAERELLEANERYQAIAERSFDVLWQIDLQGIFTYVSPAVRRIGYTEEEIVGHSVKEFLPDDEYTWFQERMKLTGFDRSVGLKELRMICRDGSHLWTEVSTNRIYENSQLARIQGISRDISKRKAAEDRLIEANAALLLSEERIRTLVTNMPGVVFRLNVKPNYGATFISDGIHDLTGYSASDFLNGIRTLPDIVHPDDRYMLRKVAIDAVENGMPYTLEYRVFDADGGMKWVQEKGQAVNHKETGSAWVDGVIYDFTDQKEAHEALISAHNELEKAYQFQKEFLNNVTHETRTPLTAVMGYVEMLLEGVAGPLTDEQAELLRRVMASSEQLLDIVSTILEISRLRSGTNRLKPRICIPSDLVNKAVASVLPQAKANNLYISVHCSEPESAGLYDEYMMTVILNNLLTNAVKFTRDGGVEVDIDSDRNGVTITIVDSGIGIMNESLSEIFDEFKQLSDLRKHKPNGFGIGLAVVAAMIDLLNATLIVSSARGIGTAFTVYVPSCNKKASERH